MLQIVDASPVTLTVAFADVGIGSLSVTGGFWSLLDENDVKLGDGGIVATQGATSASIEIPGSLNAISGQRGGRRLAITLNTAKGPFQSEQFYTIAKASVLAIGQNSFMTFTQALVLRDSFGLALAGWDSAAPRDQKAALETAWTKIGRMAFKVTPKDPTVYAGFEDEDGYGYSYLIADVRLMSAGEFASLDQRFVEALRRAQLLEADNMLSGDQIEQRRIDGILSETIGESSMMFNSRPALQRPLSREAYRELAAFVYRSVAIARG